jgi:subtilisin family serine protease
MSSEPLPAWAWQFSAGHLPKIRPLPLESPITEEWAWGGSTGTGVKVAVIDSGIDATHPRVGPISGGVIVEPDDSAASGVRITETPHEDLFGHGTACAAIIRSLAPDCEIYSVRVLGAKLSGRGTVFAAGLDWAISNGMQVANLSLSTGRASYFGMFHRLADRAYFAGTTIVAAINNVPAPSYPAQFASVISVAARDAAEGNGLAYNPSPPVEFGAPGIEINVAWKDGKNITATGNSFACPYVTGMVARVLGKHPGLTPFEVKTVLRAVASNAEGA